MPRCKIKMMQTWIPTPMKVSMTCCGGGVEEAAEDDDVFPMVD
jgi:hypothetical protein